MAFYALVSFFGFDSLASPMPRRTFSFRKVQALDNPRKLEQLTALEGLKQNSFTDYAAAIPATKPEKLVYNYLVHLGVRFYFQFFASDIQTTSYPEDVFRPDFYIPAINSYIEVFGTYWHSAPLGTLWQLYSAKREKDFKKLARYMLSGKVIIEHGIPQMIPNGGGNNGKCVIWWEEEIYFDIGHLFARDFPELLTGNVARGKPEEFILDRERELEKKRSLKARMEASKLRPRLSGYVLSERRLKRRNKSLFKQYPLWRKVQEDITFRRKKL